VDSVEVEITQINTEGGRAATPADTTRARRARTPAQEKWFRRSHELVYNFQLVLVMVAVAVLGMALVWNQIDLDAGFLCVRDTICTDNHTSLMLLVVSRLTAYAMYPCLIFVFMSKCRICERVLSESWLSLWTAFEAQHGLHIFAGHCIHALAWLHSIFHLARWAHDRRLDFLWGHQTGRTGLVAWVACALVAGPMGLAALRRRVPFEVRKTLHWCLSLVFAAGVIWHAPATNLAYVMATVTIVYLLDWLLFQRLCTFKVKTSCFTRYETGVQLRFKNPPGMPLYEGGYVNLNVPFVSKFQWHPFSTFPDPQDSTWTCISIAAAGGWTRKLHAVTERETHRSVWVQGQFPSPFNQATSFDNLILVASGIGITPCLGIINRLGLERSTNLIWICRDASLLEFYLNRVKFWGSGMNVIYYTGKRKLGLQKGLPDSVFLLGKRPNFAGILRHIIYATEADMSLTRKLRKQNKQLQKAMHQYYNYLRSYTPEALEGDTLLKAKVAVGFALERFAEEDLPGHAELFGTQLVNDLNPSAMPTRYVSASSSPGVRARRMRTRMTRQISGTSSEEPRASYVWSAKQLTAFFQDLAPEMAFGENEGVELLAVLGKEGQSTVCQQDLGRFFEETCRSFSLETGGRVTTGFNLDRGNDDFEDDGHFEQCIAESNVRLWKEWATLYCGGSSAITTSLTAVCEDIGLPFKCESFDW